MASKSEIEIAGMDGITIKIPKPFEPVYNEEKPKKLQKWERPIDPNFNFLDPEQKQEYHLRELFRIDNGFHFYNNGELIYLTGSQYGFLKHWDLGGGKYPDYRWTHSQMAYGQDVIKKDPNCYGLAAYTQKRWGKAVALDTLIPTTKGWKKMVDIHIGDFVFDMNGEPTKVLYESEIQLNRNCYKITFCDKTEVIADEEHNWLVSGKVDRARTCQIWNKNNPLKTHVKNTGELLAFMYDKNGYNNWSIRNTFPVKYEKKELLIPPYILGLWIGDGSSSYTKLTNIDREIIEDWIKYGESVGLQMKKDQDITYMLTSVENSKCKGSNYLLSALQKYDLINNKHIPIDYLTSSIEDRIELMRGIMDTDGCKDKNINMFEYCTKLKRLQTDFYELITSLGIKARFLTKANKKYNKEYYYIKFSTYEINPFKLKRKAESFRDIKSRKGGITNEFRFIKSIEKVSSVAVKCIEVESKSHTYLCSKSFIVTHNTEYVPARMLIDSLLRQKANYFIQATKDDKAKDVFKRTLNAFLSLSKSLPYIYQHTYTSESIYFRQYQTIKRSSAKVEFKDGNFTRIEALPSKVTSIQGEKIEEYFLDEFASQELMDMNQLFQTLIAQCTEGIKDIIGKIWMISTVENAKSKSVPFSEKLWHESNPLERDFNGRTKSGLYRMLIPFHLSDPSFIDEYGNPKIEDAKKYFYNMCQGADDAKVLLLRRQYPTVIDDIFDSNKDGGLELDVIAIIKNRRDELRKVVRPLYDISYYNKEVKFSIAGKEGQMTVEKYEDVMEHHRYRVGVDATSTDKNSTNKSASGGEEGKVKSKFAIVVSRITGDGQYVDVANYWIRPEKRHLSEKVALWLCMYYNKYGGCRAYPERNASAGSTLTDLFEAEGQQRILIRQLLKHNTEKLQEKSSNAYGIYINGDNKPYRTSVMNKALRLYGHQINSFRLCEDFLIYGTDNSDLADAWGVMAMSWGNFDPDTEKKEEKPKIVHQRRRMVEKNGVSVYVYENVTE